MYFRFDTNEQLEIWNVLYGYVRSVPVSSFINLSLSFLFLLLLHSHNSGSPSSVHVFHSRDRVTALTDWKVDLFCLNYKQALYKIKHTHISSIFQSPICNEGGDRLLADELRSKPSTRLSSVTQHWCHFTLPMIHKWHPISDLRRRKSRLTQP
jgi:hypothetical protein